MQALIAVTCEVCKVCAILMKPHDLTTKPKGKKKHKVPPQNQLRHKNRLVLSLLFWKSTPLLFWKTTPSSLWEVGKACVAFLSVITQCDVTICSSTCPGREWCRHFDSTPLPGRYILFSLRPLCDKTTVSQFPYGYG